MNTISYANMKLKVDNSTRTFKFKDYEIEILNYLPIEDKYDLIMITLQKSYENEGYYNPIKMNKFFNLHLMYMYTNINFTDKQREDESKLYDTLESTGLMDAFISALSENEYEELYQWLEETKESLLKNKYSIRGILTQLSEDLPKNAKAMQDIVDNFDPEKYQNVINFAKAANGNRNI